MESGLRHTRGDRDAASSATLPRTRHVAFERLVRIVNVVCCFSFSRPAGRCGEDRVKRVRYQRSDARVCRSLFRPLARFFRHAVRRRRARAERSRLEARRETRDRPLDTRRHSMRGKHRRDRHHERHVPAAEATSRMGDVPVLLVYANPKAKPPPRHALASTLWFRTSRLPTVISGRVGSIDGA